MKIVFSLTLFPYLFLIVLSLAIFSSTGRDDSHITYWSAWSLSHYGEILNYSGQRVEQSSSLLQVILLFIIYKLSGISLPTIGGLLSLLAALYSIWKVGQLADKLDFSKLQSQLFLATSAPFMYWALGGLESTLVAGILVSFYFSYIGTVNKKSKLSFSGVIFWITLFLMVRPESIFILGAFYFLLIVMSRFNKKIISINLILFLKTVLIFLLITAWRYWYFGDIFPQPVSAKIGLSMHLIEKLQVGIRYIATSIEQYPLLLIVVAPFYIVLKMVGAKNYSFPHENLALLALFISYLLFILFSGGDWMEGARFFVPIIPLLSCLIFIYCKNIFQRKGLFILLVIVNLGCLIGFAKNYSTGVYFGDHSYVINAAGTAQEKLKKFSFFELRNRVHYRDINFINATLPVIDHYKRINSNKDFDVLSIQAGMVAYHIFKESYGHLKFIDAMALSTRHFSHCFLAKSWERNSTGVVFRYEEYLKNINQFNNQCSIPVPDFIFDLDNDEGHRASLIEKYGYTIVIVQKGALRGAKPFTGGYVGFNQFLAVRNDLFIKSPILTTVIKSN
jgi:hypothetical protein